MGSIYQKAQQEQKKGFYQEILDKLEGLPADTPDWREALKNAIDDIIQAEEQSVVRSSQRQKKNLGISPAKNPRPRLRAGTELSFARSQQRIRNSIAASECSILSYTNQHTTTRRIKRKIYFCVRLFPHRCFTVLSVISRKTSPLATLE